MSVSIISRNTLCKDAIVRVCQDHKLEISSLRDCSKNLDETSLGDVLLWHLSADDAAPVDSIRALHRSRPDLRIVVLAAKSQCVRIEAQCGNALTAVVDESTSIDGLVSVLLLAGQGYCIKRTEAALPGPAGQADGHEQAHPVTDAATTVGPAERQSPLSEREAAVLAFLRAGYSNKSIAKELGICDATVKAHLRSSFRRIGATNRTQAAVWASRNL